MSHAIEIALRSGKPARWGFALLLLLAAWGEVSAQDVPEKTVPGLNATTVSGGVRHFTVTPTGAVDGAELGNGAKIHWPPVFGDKVQEVIAVGDRVQVMGPRVMDPAAESVFEARTITNLRTGKSLDLSRLPAPRPDHPSRLPPPRPDHP